MILFHGYCACWWTIWIDGCVELIIVSSMRIWKNMLDFIVERRWDVIELDENLLIQPFLSGFKYAVWSEESWLNIHFYDNRTLVNVNAELDVVTIELDFLEVIYFSKASRLPFKCDSSVTNGSSETYSSSSVEQLLFWQFSVIHWVTNE